MSRYGVVGKKGTGRRAALLKNSLLQDILWSFSGWLTENLISSWACNCRSFCSMSAIADLINKVLWQCTVYFQGLDLRAAAQGWDTVYPTYTHTDRLTQHAVCVRARSRTNAHLGPGLLYHFVHTKVFGVKVGVIHIFCIVSHKNNNFLTSLACPCLIPKPMCSYWRWKSLTTGHK